MTFAISWKFYTFSSSEYISFFLSICAVFKICPFHYYFIFSCQECNLFGNAFPVSINRMILRFLVKSFSIKRKIVQGCCAQTFSNCSSPLNSDFGSKFWSNVSKIQSKSDFPEAVVSTRVTANRPWGNSLECLWLHLPFLLKYFDCIQIAAKYSGVSFQSRSKC